MISHAVSSRCTRLLEAAPDNDHATRALFSGGILQDDALLAGTRLDARYQTLRVLGRGGFGITYEAREENSGKLFAIKEFFPLGCRRENGELVPGALQSFERLAASRRRFVEDAHILSSFRHPNLVRILGVFEERGTAFLVMENLRGATLLQLVETRGALEEKFALALAEKLCDALDALHRVGFLHLDVKPENVIACDLDDASAISDDDNTSDEKRRVVLMDFDLLRPLGGETERITQPLFHATHCGTPGYAPVEQYSQSAQLSRETDVYALGATLFHLLTGAPPPASTDRAASGAQFSGARWDELSTSTREAISLAMQVRQRDRPASVRDFRAALRGENRDAAPAKAASTRTATTRRATGVLRASTLPKTPISPFTSAPQAAASTRASAARDEIYRVQTRKGVAVTWPVLCPCCGGAPNAFLPLKSETETLQVPYCARCVRHIGMQKHATRGGIAGILTGLSLAAAGFALSDPFIGPLGIAVHFTAMCYGGLQMGVADKLSSSQCCAVESAVALQTKNARFWKFRNGHYAGEFKRLNG